MMERQKVFRYVILFLSGLACLLLFLPFTKEILSAIFFAFALSPILQKLSKKKFFHRRGWVAVTLFGLILAVVMPIVLIINGIIALVNDMASEGFQQSPLYQDLNNARTAALSWANELMETIGIAGRFDLVGHANRALKTIGTEIVQISGSIASQLPTLIVSLFIFCCALYYFLAEGRRIRNLLAGNNLAYAHELDELIPQIQTSCYATLIAAVVVGAIQASVVTGGALILGGNHLFLIFLITFIFSFIPVLGAAPVAFLLGFLALVKGDYGIAIGYVVFGLAAGTVDNIVRPYLVRGKEDIHPVIMLLAILGAILIFGIPGIFLGPMFVLIAFQVFKIYIFKNPDQDPNAVQTPMEQLNKV